jgi:nucleoside-diphosphate-sugar epimerase
MRILVAGASGAIGRQLVPILKSTGHTPIALVHENKEVGGASAIAEADALDRKAVAAAVAQARPDAIVNLLTAIPQQLNPRRFASQMALTNRLRTVGTANLIAAGADLPLVSASVAFAYAPDRRGGLADEGRRLWTDGPKQFRPAAAALVELERMTVEHGGIVLRMGHLYGPGTMFAAGGSFTEQVRAGKAPIVGDGHGTFSFIHTHDAATAILSAVERPELSGPLNVVDDVPISTGRWLPLLAEVLAAPKPKRVPAGLARLAVGSWDVAYMNGLVGASNQRARTTLEWRPRFPSVENGFRLELQGGPAPAIADIAA